MTTEKRTIDKENCIFNVSTVVVDIEGTTTSINFVKETLFPYAREHLEEYVNSKWSDKELQEDVALLRKQAVKDVADKVEGVIDIPEGDGEDIKKSVIKNVLWQMDGDRKTKALKQLQGHLWRSGYSSGKIVGHVYDDVKDCLKSWKEAGKNMYVYSSGSVEAQKLLFGNTKDGDLLSIFSGFFDTEVGPKTESSSYIKIIENLKGSGHVTSGAKDVLFLTDVLKEAEAATDAGMQVAIVIREGNTPLPEGTKGSFQTISSFSEITLEGNAKRRKLSDESENIENDELKIENVKGGNDIVKDEEMEVCTNDDSTVSDSVTTNNLDDTNKKKSEPVSVNSEDETCKANQESASINSGESIEVKSKTEDYSVETGEKTSETTAKETAITKSEKPTGSTPDSVNANSEENEVISSSVNSNPKKISTETSDSVDDNSVETCKPIPDSVSGKIETSKGVSAITPTGDELKSSSEDVSSSADPSTENCTEPTGETKVKEALKSGSADIVNVADCECSGKEGGHKLKGSGGIENVNSSQNDNKVNVPDSTVASDDVEMKDDECESEKGTKVDEGKSIDVEDKGKFASPEEVKEPLKKQETSSVEKKMIEDSCNGSVIEKKPEEPKFENSLPENKLKEKENILGSENPTKDKEKKETDESKVENSLPEKKLKDVENTLVTNNLPKEEENKQLSEKQLETSNKETESKSDVRKQLDDKQVENETILKEHPDDCKANGKVVNENRLDNTKQEAMNSDVSDMEVIDQGLSSTEKGTVPVEKSVTDLAMEVDKDNENETVLEKSENITDAKKSEEDSQNSCKVVNSESDCKKGSAASDNVTDSNKKEGETGEKRLSEETEEVKKVGKESTNTRTEDKLVSGKVEEPVVDKTENEKADCNKIVEETNDVINNEEKTNGNEETDNIKTDLNNATPNGTHKTCKNGVLEDNNISDDCNIKEKIKESVTEQSNGTENVGEV